MNSRLLAGGAGLIVLAALAAWAIGGESSRLAPRAPAERPGLALLTSLPLLFGEHFGLDQGGSPALARIEQRYRVEPISVADAASLDGRRLLLLAHPRAQPAETLVELHAWVTGGGRALLLADPRLEWPSTRPLGDLLRPPPAFADTGLLRHWGMTLVGPARPGEAQIEVSGQTVTTAAPGTIRSRSCRLEAEGFLARCPIGKGMVIVIADADFLNVEQGGGEQNLEFLMRELDRLETR